MILSLSLYEKNCSTRQHSIVVILIFCIRHNTERQEESVKVPKNSIYCLRTKRQVSHVFVPIEVGRIWYNTMQIDNAQPKLDLYLGRIELLDSSRRVQHILTQ